MAHYKLNDEGRIACEKWLDLYYQEMDRLDKENPNHGHGGWSILWDGGYIKNIHDFVEMLVCFYEDDALQYTYDVQSNYWDDDTEYEFGYTFAEVREMLKHYYVEEE